MINSIIESNWQKAAVVIAFVACISSAWSSWNAFEISKNANQISERALIIQEETYNVIEPFQKPILYNQNSQVNSTIENVTINEEFGLDFVIFARDEEIDNGTAVINSEISTVGIGFDILYNLTNAGKGIAENFEQLIFIANLNDSTVQFLGKTSYADNIYPNNPVKIEINFNIRGGFTEEIAKGEELGLIIRYDYDDYLTAEEHNQTFWNKIKVGVPNILIMSTDEKEMLFNNYIDEVKKVT